MLLSFLKEEEKYLEQQTELVLIVCESLQQLTFLYLQKKGEQPTGQQRRKHQITYLIHQVSAVYMLLLRFPFHPSLTLFVQKFLVFFAYFLDQRISQPSPPNTKF